ncbi:ABC transporter permease [Paenibacillus lutrae]|uniref:ABC transporter permease subunit n=1 Tax=Paenibacillus lutrae TaxID=2078573 RepID=A0A7X3FKX7_9BACL|nr:ABC transporter permease [Paenibacillus lutrae]MVP01625.1 ABC transporter permease subunit [Paenibacillus lutrae]
MTAFGKVLAVEWLKLRKSNIWLLLFVSPVLASLAGVLDAERSTPQIEWVLLLSNMALIHALLFLPLLTGVFAAFVCRYEHTGGGWKQILALPVSRLHLYTAKFLIVVLLLAVSQLLLLGGLLGAGFARGFGGPIPWSQILWPIFGGWLATLPLAALQLWVSAAWASFATPLALNVIFTLPNILVANSETYGPFYPWVQPFLAMLPARDDSFGALHTSLDTLLYVIAGGFVVFFAAGLAYFQRKEI